MKGKERYDVWGMPTDNVEIKKKKIMNFSCCFLFIFILKCSISLFLFHILHLALQYALL